MIWVAEDDDEAWAFGETAEACLRQLKRTYRKDATWEEMKQTGEDSFTATCWCPARNEPGFRIAYTASFGVYRRDVEPA